MLASAPLVPALFRCVVESGPEEKCMRDEWTKTLPDGRSVSYSSDGAPGVGAVISAKIEGQSVGETTNVPAPLTREQVEAAFADFVAKSSKRVSAS